MNLFAPRPPAPDTPLRAWSGYPKLLGALREQGIPFAEVDGEMPADVFFHNRVHALPQLVVWPSTTQAVSALLAQLHALGLYGWCPISVKSGGHSYFADSACTGIVIDLARMRARSFDHERDTLVVEPGVVIGNLVHAFHQEGRVVPHGDCASVGVGGHWSTAGWDVLLSRRYGLGSQNVRSAEVVLWDGTVVQASAASHPELLWAVRGAGAAEVGIVTRFEMQTFAEPEAVSLCRVKVSRAELAWLSATGFITASYHLPDSLSMIVDYVFAPEGGPLCCALEIFSLLPPADTLEALRAHFSPAVMAFIEARASWIGDRVYDVRIAPYSDTLKESPEALGTMTGAEMTRSQESIWKPDHLDREMRHSYFAQRSYWLGHDRSDFLVPLWDAFARISDPQQRRHTYGAVIVGGGAIVARQPESSMPLGSVVVRFETHWNTDTLQARQTADALCDGFTAAVSEHIDHTRRPYRGDIWKESQKMDDRSEMARRLCAVFEAYNRRPSCADNPTPSPYESLREGAGLREALRLHRALALAHLDSVQQAPVRPPTPPEPLAAQLPLQPGAAGLPLDAVAERLAAALACTPVTGSRRFFNQLFGGSDPAAVLGDMLVPLLNSLMYTFKAAGPHVLIENALIERMARIAGMPGAEGTFTPGGSLSNQTAMMLARNVRTGCRDAGLSGARLRVYTSAEAHYSIRKAAGILGIGRGNVVSVPTDERGRMDPQALASAIAADQAAGHTPLMINATAGTTVQGAFDPIDEIADVAEAEGVWLHVDGAWGGSLLLSAQTRHLLQGLDRADSLTWDAHKMMGVPLTCSLLLVRQPGLLTEHLNESAGYLLQGDTDRYNPATRSIQCGRRNDVLKLWAAWLHHGDDGYAQRIEHLAARAAYAASVIERAPDLRLSHRPQSLNVCFEVTGRDSAAIADALHAEGLAMIGTGTVSGRPTLRLVCVNPDLRDADIDAFFAAVRDVAARLPPG